MHFRNGFSTLQGVNSYFLNKDPDIVPEESLLIILDRNYSVFMDNTGKDTKHTRHIYRRVIIFRNCDKCNIHNIE